MTAADVVGVVTATVGLPAWTWLGYDLARGRYTARHAWGALWLTEVIYGLIAGVVGLPCTVRASALVAVIAAIGYWWCRRRRRRRRAAAVIGAKARAIRARLIQTLRDRAVPGPPQLRPEGTPA